MIRIIVLTSLFALVFIQQVASHGAMVKPHSWFDFKQYVKSDTGDYVYDYVGMKSEQQCLAGCFIPPQEICNEQHPCDGYEGPPGCACMWFQNNTKTTGPTIYDPKLRTYDIYEPRSYFFNPWRAPGSARVDSPCGVAGGNLNGCDGDCIHYGGFGHGPQAEKVDFGYSFYVTQWARGEAVEVAWGISANHGGGYSYRLCKVPTEGVKGLTEECFQQTPLDFVGDKQWIQYGEDESTRVEIEAVRTRRGTFPKGSQWTKNPIPACHGIAGGYFDAECPEGTQFPPPKPGLFGFGVNIKKTVEPFKFSIVDKVLIPEQLETGEYVLSFRWDCEQTSQIWNTCSSIYIF